MPDDLGYQLEKEGIQFLIPRNVDAKNADITILIGAQDMWRFCYENDIKRLNKSGVTINSLFGWAVQGNINIENKVESFVCNLSIGKEEGFDYIRRFWELESFGTGKELINEEEISDDVIALEQFENSIKFTENRYEVRLPWRDPQIELDDNYEIAKRRFFNLIKRFKWDAKLFEEYKKILEEQKENNIIEKVDERAKRDEKQPLYYIPHRAVVRKQRETTKLRIVYNAGSKGKNSYSLNEVLLKGPQLMPELIKILLRFRMKKFAFTADIKQSFLQISIAEIDRDALRFL